MVARILVVDDDPSVCRLLETELARCGFQAWAVGSAAEALRQLDLLEPDVLLTDVLMEGMDGMQLCGQIASHRPDVPVVVMTAAIASKRRSAPSAPARTTSSPSRSTSRYSVPRSAGPRSIAAWSPPSSDCAARSGTPRASTRSSARARRCAGCTRSSSARLSRTSRS